MSYETGSRLLDRLERRLGHLALSGLLRWVAVFQFLTWLLSLFSPDFLNWLAYDLSAIYGGQVWRLASWVIFPASTNPLFVLFALFFLFYINDGLESEWGSFRLNLYVFASVAILAILGLTPLGPIAALLFNHLFYTSTFLAFATLFPNHVIYLLGIIPLKAKWLGWANVALLSATVLGSQIPLLLALIVILGLTPYFLTFAPGFLQKYRREARAKVHRHQFQTEAPTKEGAFHECEDCGATEITHPEREFRVSPDGRERCNACRQAS